MRLHKSLLKPVVLLSILTFPLLAQQEREDPERNSQAVEILRRAMQAVGGSVALAGVHDITEKGQIIFYWSKDVTGSTTIQMLGANHFRLDYELQGRKTVWTLRNGFGFEHSEARTRSIPHVQAINLDNLIFPIGHPIAAIADPLSQISFVDIEKYHGRPVYRVRLSNNLGLAAKAHIIGTTNKELIVDAVSYDIVSVEDQPRFLAKRPTRTKHHTALRQIEYSDFRWVNGVRLPFSITIRDQGQKATTILLDEIIFNSNLRDEDFGS